ncbi:sulfatase [uncultured Paraglaciecola sp.]|uniref:sulfatase n=1 Tax=uncultured Paraglaciecola sp. TaxID=1765024 RepID=UPI0030DBC87E|tara:strand:+ start:132228 stop:133760 length:1533 start_codon:yes stop_codon:yes gene_type:complete
MKKMAVLVLISYLFVACSGNMETNIMAKDIDKTSTLIEANKNSNVVFILVDDLGYSDIKAYNQNSFYETPNVDQLALTGTKFNNGYSANPVCSPSRYALLTGKHPSRVDSTDFFRHDKRKRRAENFEPAAIKGFLASEEQTMAETFQENGYTTSFLGKWHLGSEEKHWPENNGFDVNVGGHAAGSPSGYFSPHKNPRLSDGEEGEYLTERLTNEAINLLDGYAKQDKPFFMYLAYYTVHTPLGAPQETVDKYENKAKQLGLTNKDSDFKVEEQVWPVDTPRKVRTVQNHATYAAMVEEMDNNVGRILDKLKQTGLDKDTIIVFTSDNGGLSTSEGSPTSNLPLRGGKGWLYEGGIKVPYIVKLPNTSSTGIEVNTPVFGTDFYPTLTQLVGIKPDNKDVIDGISLKSLLAGDDITKDLTRPLFFHYPHYSNQGGFPGSAVRLGDWKLIERFEDGSQNLFNLSKDPGELVDLAETNPQKLNELTKILHNWYVDVDAKFLQEKSGKSPWTPN